MKPEDPKKGPQEPPKEGEEKGSSPEIIQTPSTMADAIAATRGRSGDVLPGIIVETADSGSLSEALPMPSTMADAIAATRGRSGDVLPDIVVGAPVSGSLPEANQMSTTVQDAMAVSHADNSNFVSSIVVETPSFDQSINASVAGAAKPDNPERMKYWSRESQYPGPSALLSLDHDEGLREYVDRAEPRSVLQPGFVGKTINYIRKRRMSSPMAANVDRTARTFGSGGLFYYLGNLATHARVIRFGVMTGSGWVKYGLPAAATLPLLAIPARKIVASRHENSVNTELEKTLEAINTKLDSALTKKHVEAILEEHLEKPDTSLENDEIDLMRVLHQSEFLKIAETPHLFTSQRYAKHAFTEFWKCLEKAKRTGVSVRGLDDGSEKMLAAFFDQFDTLKKQVVREEGHTEAESDEEVRVRLEKAWDKFTHVCASYGRLLADHQQNKTEGQVTGAIAGASLSVAAGTGGLGTIPAAIIGSSAWGVRKLYRWVARMPQTMQISSSGDLLNINGSKTLPYKENSATEGGDLYRPDLLHQFTEKGQLPETATDDKKINWYKRIVIPEDVIKRGYTSAEALALHAASPVLESLVQQKLTLKKDWDKDEVKKREKRVERLTKQLEEAGDTLKSKKARIQSLEIERKGRQRILDSAEEKKKKIKDINVKIKEEQTLLRSAEAESNESEIEEIGGRIKELEDEKQRLSNSGADANEIAKADARLEELKDEKLLKDEEIIKLQGFADRQQVLESGVLVWKDVWIEGDIEKCKRDLEDAEKALKETEKPQSTTVMSREEIARNEDVVKTFCVKVHEALKRSQEVAAAKSWGWTRGLGGKAGAAALQPLKAAGEFAVEGTAKVAASATAAGVATWAAGNIGWEALQQLSAILPTPLHMAIIFGGAAGATHVYRSLMKLFRGGGRSEKEKEKK